MADLEDARGRRNGRQSHWEQQQAPASVNPAAHEEQTVTSLRAFRPSTLLLGVKESLARFGPPKAALFSSPLGKK